MRFLPRTLGNPHGANAEVKVIDPSANPYLASAAILALRSTASNTVPSSRRR